MMRKLYVLIQFGFSIGTGVQVYEKLAPREQHFEEMKTRTRSRDAAKPLIVGTVRQILARIFPVLRAQCVLGFESILGRPSETR
jgi:hypothetical protein